MANKEINEVREGEKIRPIILKDRDTGDTYTLEFNRDSVKFAEARGFDVDDVSRYPATKLEELFFYAFRMHHQNVAREKTNRILWEKLGGLPEGFVERLTMLYMAPLEALKRAAEGSGEEKNASMTVEM